MSVKGVKLTFGKGKTSLAHQKTSNLMAAGFDVEVVPITVIVRVPEGSLSSAQISEALKKIAVGFTKEGVQAELLED